MAAQPSRRFSTPKSDESQVSLATTVFWLLCVLSAIAAESVALITWAVRRFVESHPLEMIGGVALFVALVTAFVGLLMVPIVLRVRTARPPPSALQLTYAVAVTAIIFAAVLR